MRVHSRFFAVLLPVLALLSLIGLGQVFAQSQREPDATALVNCFDPKRQMVRRTRADQCEGRIISDAEADRVRQRRRSYIAESIEERDDATIIGKKLRGIGAGFVVDSSGSILTNAHVVDGCSALTVSSPNGDVTRVKLMATQVNRDLALLRGDLRPTSAAQFAAEPALAGADVFIVGYPNQGLPPLIPLLTEGHLSERRGGVGQALEFKAPVRPGNSGGPVLNGAGQVVGVVFAAVDTSKIYREQGRVVRDQGVAIPSAMVRDFLKGQGITAEFKPWMVGNREPHSLLQSAREYVVRVECWD